MEAQGGKPNGLRHAASVWEEVNQLSNHKRLLSARQQRQF